MNEEPPYSQGEESIEAIASMDSPVEGVSQGKQDRQELKEEPPDGQGEESRVEEFFETIPCDDRQLEGVIQGGGVL